MEQGKSQIFAKHQARQGKQMFANKTREKQYFHDTAVEKSNCAVNHSSTLGCAEPIKAIPKTIASRCVC